MPKISWKAYPRLWSAPRIGGGVVQAVGLGPANVVGGKFEPFDVHGVLCRSPCRSARQPSGLRRPARLRALPAAPCVRNSSIIASSSPKRSGRSPRVFVGQDALLIELHGKPDGHARRHGVEPELVAEAVRGDDRIQIFHTGGAPERVHRLELRPLGQNARVLSTRASFI